MNALALDLVWLGCGALFGARGRVVMNRLTLHPMPDAPAQLAAPVLDLLDEAWPEERGPLCLSPTTEALRKLSKADHVKAFLAVEMSSTGQMIDDVRLSVEGRKPIHYLGHAGGVMPTVEEMVEAAKKALKEVK